jgi:predicted ATP-dependent endonuclease of OLD family
MTEITIKNFQSIESVNFAINGFTVIVGKNNIGKSAVIRAIDASLTNLTGKSFIRHGKDETEVRVQRGELDILWKKGDKAVYKVNGENFSALNRAIPKPLEDAGFCKMEIGDKKVSLNLAPQFDPLFLLNESGPTVTEVLATLYDLDVYSVADDLCQKELRSQKSLLKTRDSDLQTLKGTLAKYDGFEDVKSNVELMGKMQAECDSLKTVITELSTFEQDLSTLSKSVQRLQKIKGVTIPDVASLQIDLEECAWLGLQEDLLNTSFTTVKRLQAIKDVIIPDSKDNEARYKEVLELEALDLNLLTLVRSIEKLSPIKNITLPDSSVLKTIQNDLEDILSAENLYNDAVEKVSMLSTISSISLDSISSEVLALEKGLKDYQSLKELDETFRGYAVSYKGIRDDLKTVTSKYDEKVKEFEALRKELKLCPLCDRPY